jgi:hypothetical protein
LHKGNLIRASHILTCRIICLHINSSHAYSHHGSDDQPDSPMGMPVGSDAMSAAGSRDPNSAYSTSAPSPTSAQAMLNGRPKRRTDVYGAHESPYFYPAQQFYRLCNMNQSTRQAFCSAGHH